MDCPHEETLIGWQHFKNGTAHIRKTCKRCGFCLGYLPQTPWNTTLADDGQKEMEVIKGKKQMVEYEWKELTMNDWKANFDDVVFSMRYLPYIDALPFYWKFQNLIKDPEKNGYYLETWAKGDFGHEFHGQNRTAWEEQKAKNAQS